jgi:hypothetical protein
MALMHDLHLMYAKQKDIHSLKLSHLKAWGTFSCQTGTLAAFGRTTTLSTDVCCASLSVISSGQRPRDSVPHTCHDGWLTTVIGSHSKVLQRASDLGASRSAATMK